MGGTQHADSLVWDAENPNLQSVVTAITSKLYAAGGFGVQDNVHDREKQTPLYSPNTSEL